MQNNEYNEGYESGYRAAMQMQSNLSKSKAEPKKAVIVVKCVVIHFVAMILFWFAVEMVVVTIEEYGDDTADTLGWCERNYNDMNYSSLMSMLDLYDTLNEKYDKYWEFMEGYDLYAQCYQWAKYEESGEDDASEMLSRKLSELEDMAKNTEFSTNKAIFEDFIREINELK